MRVVADQRYLEVEPGVTAVVDLEIVNTGEVIDGISAHILGFPGECVVANPAMLPLFPNVSGRVSLDLAVPASHPAGVHALMVEVVSHGTSDPASYLDIDLEVASRPAMRIAAKPRLVRARRSGRFVLELVNTGNVPLDVTLSASDPDRQVQTTFTPDRRRIEAGAVAPVIMTVRGPRMFTGAELDRSVLVLAFGRPVPVVPPGVSDPDRQLNGEVPAEVDLVLERRVTVQLRQRPLISRGVLTILVLMSIVALWAGTFLLGLARVFASDPMTKEAPASFFASLNTGKTQSGTAVGAAGASNIAAAGTGSGGGGTGASVAAGGVPAGALDKSGQVPVGMGGTINGTVVAVNDAQPVGLVLVRAFRMGVTGLVQMSSAATQADGTYSMAGLFPTSYYIEFSATGYKTQWYPDRPGRAGATPVTAVAQGAASGINATVVGLPATISGRIDPGETLNKVTTRVTARALSGAHVGHAFATAVTNAAGSYRLARLPAPGSYELTFTTAGYQASTLVVSVDGGDARLESTVSLAAGGGQISGLILDGTAPLGGAKVTTTVAGKAVTVTTPTTGNVGSYVLGNLPTPATYVVTVSSPGHGTSTKIVDLTAGQKSAGLDVVLANGIGSVSGRVVDAAGNGVGGVQVVVGGSTGTAPTATTLTAGSPGSFSIDGLRAPGSYTLTVTAAGYEPASVPVTLSATSTTAPVEVRLVSRLGGINGTITGPAGAVYAGATVTATDGQHSFTTTSNSSDGAYVFSGLGAGIYSVTVTAAGMEQQTALVPVTAGVSTAQNLRLGS